MSLFDVQKRLKSLDIDPGAIDGKYGRRTENAIMRALDVVAGKVIVKPDPDKFRVVPIEFMPSANMKRVIVHWSAGRYKAGASSLRAYHLCVEGPLAKLVRGNNSIKANEKIVKGKPYAAHTRGINTGSIGLSAMSMKDAKEVPFNPGKFPMQKSQWDMMVVATADLCERYSIPVTPETVLSHAEVQDTLGVWQRQKWDFTRLPFNLRLRGARSIGNEFRREVQTILEKD